MIQYKDYSYTPPDPSGLALEDYQDWYLSPATISRDSGLRAKSNYVVIEDSFREVDPDKKDHKEFTFDHWGPGWFRITLVRPNSECYKVADEWEAFLSDYPVCSDSHYSELEYEEKIYKWEYMRLRDRIDILNKAGISIFASRRNIPPNDAFQYIEVDNE